MKRILLSLVLITGLCVAGAQQNYALLIIDVQNFYFPGGRSELVDPEAAAGMAAIAAARARAGGEPVIYIQHKASSGMEINDIVRPAVGDAVFIKEEVNSFLGTGLKEHLDSLGIDTLVICGMQTQMCVEAAVRAAHDFGYHVVLLHDACATRNLKFGDREVSAADVQASTLATLRSYSQVVSVNEWTER
ncbi:MAG: isochorismatase family protein [Bacteroidales bacterium]|jgi:nicotinamidase-related amidase|nr:isochorismatase family protein [Bacteroidales bacterium]